MSTLAVLLALVGRVVFSFADPAIGESSGLVDLGRTMVTTDDSGTGPLVYVVDSRTGRTVGHTTYTSGVVDPEALAPAGPHAVWIGDIGDNAEQRPSVRVYRVPVGRGDRRVAAPSYELRYPDGPHDAESLVVSRTGRLYVITKGILGGTVYTAPRRLTADRPNRLRAVATVDVWATDAALFPDQRHVLVRGYDSAVIYTFPGFRPVGAFDLPRERQGEGLSIGASGRVRLSSEGVHSRVLQIGLPDAVRKIVEPGPPMQAGHPAGSPVPADAVPAGSGSHAGLFGLVTLALAVTAGAGWVVRRRSR